MSPRIEPKFSLEDFGPYAFAHRLSTFPYAEGKYAPHLHIQAYHESVKTTKVIPYVDETIELNVPRKFTLSDTKHLVAENEVELFLGLKTMLDDEFDYEPAAPTYGNTIPFLGKEIEVHALPDSAEGGSHMADNAIYVPSGFTPDEIREAVLDVFGDMAYSLFKPKTDRFAGQMNIQYGNLGIDDGRRTFGIFHGETKEIFLSRRLLLMSEDIIDFLIVHELAHDEYLSHGPEHDAVMSRVLPNHEDIDIAFHEACDYLLRQGWI